MPVLYSVLMTIQVLSAISIVAGPFGRERVQIWEQPLALEVPVLFLARLALQTSFLVPQRLRHHFFSHYFGASLYEQGPNIESSAPVGIRRQFLGATQEDESIVIPDEEGNSDTDSGPSKIPD